MLSCLMMGNIFSRNVCNIFMAVQTYFFKLLPMLCWECGAEMRLVQVTKDTTMPVSGYEHHTWQCSGCSTVEQRMTFTRKNTPTQIVPVEPTQPMAEEPTRTVSVEPTQTVPLKSTKAAPVELLQPTDPELPAARLR